MTTKALNQQFKRLRTLPFAPEGDGLESAGREFQRIANRDCQSDMHLEAVIDVLMDRAQRFPAPADFVQAIQDTPNPTRVKGPMGCTECQGSGWRHFERRVKTAAGSYMADFSDFCNCERGDWMRKADKARKEEEQAKAERKALRS